MNAHEALQQMVSTWVKGGWVIGALAVLATIMYATATHLLISLHHRGLRKATDSQVRLWVQDPDRAPRSLREVIRYTQDEVESLLEIEGRFREVESSTFLEADRRLAFLAVLVVSAPLFGLLGTVLGMLLTFKAISIGGASTSEVVATGISEALVATQTGLMVALPGLMAAFVAKRWRSEYASFVARLEAITLRYFRPRFHGMTRIITRRERVPVPGTEPSIQP